MSQPLDLDAQDDRAVRVLSISGAMCGVCGDQPGDQPGDRNCADCERVRRGYIADLRAAGWAPQDERDALVAEICRLRRQRKYLIDQLAKRDAETGRGNKALREFLAAEPAEETSAGVADPQPARCGARHHQHPDTACTEPPGHYHPVVDPHAGPLILDGRKRGTAAWDEPATQP